jgi:two-component system, cell cycle sensor histidine kinase and response regulator CckA
VRPELTTTTATADLDVLQRLQERAAVLIRQVLDFSRKSVTAPRRVNLRLAVEETADLLRRTLPSYLSISVDTPPEGRGWEVQFDPGRLQQVLMNLAVNSRDAMPDGGELRLAITTAPELPGWVCLSVRDTGSGISPELLEKVFDPFFTTKPTGQGTGLGLAQVYGIVSQHGGRVELSSRPGRGTEVRVLLPLVTAGGPE